MSCCRVSSSPGQATAPAPGLTAACKGRLHSDPHSPFPFSITGLWRRKEEKNVFLSLCLSSSSSSSWILCAVSSLPFAVSLFCPDGQLQNIKSSGQKFSPRSSSLGHWGHQSLRGHTEFPQLSLYHLFNS